MPDKITAHERRLIDDYLDQMPRPASRPTKTRVPASHPDRIWSGPRPKLRPDARRTALGPMPVQAALEWAFRREAAQLELPERRSIEERGSGFGMEYVLMERARLGNVRIDTSIGTSEPHEDAETIAAIVSNLPDDLGGLRQAIRVSELARAGLQPDWMPGAVPRWQPMEWRRDSTSGHEEGRAEVCGQWVEHFEIAHPKNPAKLIRRTRRHDLRWVPCRLHPTPGAIARARANYQDWWFSLSHIRRALKGCGMLREVSVTEVMPELQPWDRNVPSI